jgi:hypothetical protein
VQAQRHALAIGGHATAVQQHVANHGLPIVAGIGGDHDRVGCGVYTGMGIGNIQGNAMARAGRRLRGCGTVTG